MKKLLSSLFSNGKKEDSSEAAERVAQKNFDIFKFDGIRALKIGQSQYAIKCFTEALNIKEDYEVRYHLVSALSLAGDLDEALEALDILISDNPEVVDPMHIKINLLFLLDRDQEVVDLCEQIIELDPENSVAYLQRGKAKRVLKDLTGAIADFSQSISLNEEFPETYMLRAGVFLEMNSLDESLRDVNKVVELEEDNEHAYLLRGRIYEQMGDESSAMNDFQFALEMNPFDENAWLSSGQLLIKQGKFEEAISQFDEALDVKPEFAKAYAERGRAKNEMGDKEGAVEDLKKSIELDPEGEESQRFEGVHTNFEDMYKGGIF